jgi:hypothetical protein
MSTVNDESKQQTGERWARLREVVARRINAQPLPWEVKVEVWAEEMAESETTFARVLKLCGEFVPE